MAGRRRFLRILAAVPGLALTSAYGLAQADGAREPRALHSWYGTALGADARIQVVHEDAAEGTAILARCQAEIELLESTFSLYRENSVLSKLNAQGKLTSAPDEFFELLRISQEVYAATEGYFDPSVQPLWNVYASAVKPELTNEALLFLRISDCRDRIGFHHVDLTSHGVNFRKPGMALTLNGIAQGYLTDRLVALLRRAGLHSALVETGESYGMGNHPGGHAWRLGVPDPRTPGRLTRVVSLENRAVATSAPSGTIFDRAGQFHHLFNPHTGRCTRDWSSVTVKAPSAAIADALSTAFSAMPRKMVLDTVGSLPEIGIHMVGSDGSITESGVI